MAKKGCKSVAAPVFCVTYREMPLERAMRRGCGKGQKRGAKCYFLVVVMCPPGTITAGGA